LEIDRVLECTTNPVYFIDEFCWIEDKVQRGWVRFKLWEEQKEAVKTIATNRQVIILKARQLGLTWLTVCYALWMMLFRQGSGILLFSRRENEAAELLERMRGVHGRLPESLQAEVTVDNEQELGMGKIGSWARCFPSTKHSGRAHSATMAIVDEADFIPDLRMLLNAVKPTIDGGGRLVLISTANKENRNSAYKRIWHGAVKGMNGYRQVFLPWNARPDRDQAWYGRQTADYELDDLYQEYPANPEQALSGRRSSKRFQTEWVTRCAGSRHQRDGIAGGRIGNSPGLRVPGYTAYAAPKKGLRYLVSADPAEGNPGSDPSAAVVLDAESWEEVGVIYGLYEPDIFAGYLVQVGRHYNEARILVERNNHGHAVLLALEYAGYGNLYVSPMDKKAGWLSNRRDKVLAVDHAAQVMREGACRINHEGTLAELAVLEAGTLKAPEGAHDDLAMAFINGLAGLWWKSWEENRGEGVSVVVEYPDIIEGLGSG
jgi:hypothetical protein